MHVIAKKGLVLTAAVAGLLFTGTGISMADSATATGSTTLSPGVASGNNVQVPANVPVCVNGNTVQVVGVANGAWGNKCKQGDSWAALWQKSTLNPGILSGNNVGAALNIPIGVNGNTISGIGVGNWSAGNTSWF